MDPAWSGTAVQHRLSTEAVIFWLPDLLVGLGSLLQLWVSMVPCTCVC